MVKPTKTQLIQIRDESYREQTVECCGTCRHFVPHYMAPHYSGPLSGRTATVIFSGTTIKVESRCKAIKLRGDIVRKDVSYLGICDLYEAREDGAK